MSATNRVSKTKFSAKRNYIWRSIAKKSAVQPINLAETKRNIQPLVDKSQSEIISAAKQQKAGMKAPEIEHDFQRFVTKSLRGKYGLPKAQFEQLTPFQKETLVWSGIIYDDNPEESIKIAEKWKKKLRHLFLKVLI